MLTLRREQILVLADARLANERARAIVDQLVPWVRSTYWDAMLDRTDDDLRVMLRAILARSLAYGLDRLEDHCAFVELELAHGPSFETKSAYLGQTLTDARLRSGAKIALVRQRLEQP